MRGRPLGLLVPLALGVAVAAALFAAPARELHLTKLNRVYSDLAGEIPPYEMPPVTVTLRSSHQTVLVKDNRVRLEPLGGGRFRGAVAIDLLGKGDLVADVDLGGGSQRLNDELLVPPQTIEVEGIVRLARAAGGYRVTTEKLPASVKVAIRSRLVGQLLDTCAGASLLSLGSLDCAPLADRLEHPEVPLPTPGTEFFLGDDELTTADRDALDALLAGG